MSLRLVRSFHISRGKWALNDCLALGAFVEPCYVLYDIDNHPLTEASQHLRECLQISVDSSVVERARAQRIARVKLWNEGATKTVRIYLITLAYLCIHVV